jgi:hypothetical protein
MVRNSAHENPFAPPRFGRISCNIEVEDVLVAGGAEEDFSTEAVEAEDLSTKESATEDEESSVESEIKLGGGELSERDDSDSEESESVSERDESVSKRDESVSERDESVAEAGRGGLLSAG